MTRLVPPSVVLASVLLFLASLMWSALTPGFQTPDELQHTNSVIRLAEGGGWPAPGDLLVEDETLEARYLAGAVRDGRSMAFPRGTDPIPPEAPYFANVTPTGVDDRLSFRELDDGPVDEGPIDQMTQHPPGYYGVAAVVYDLLGAGDWRYDRAMFLIRALTALMVALTVPVCCYVAGRELTGRSSVGQIAAFVPLLIPQLSYISGAVTNDGAAIATTAVMWAAMFRVTCSGPTIRRLVFLAVAVAAACWTKGTAVALLPTVPLAIAVAYHRHIGGSFRTWARPALLAIVATSSLAFVLGGWWWGLNLLRYGRIQPAAYEIPPNGPDRAPVPARLRARCSSRGCAGRSSSRSGCGSTTRCALLTLVLTLVFVVLIAVGAASRRHLGDRLVMLLGAAATVGVLFGTTYSAHLQSNRLPGHPGALPVRPPRADRRPPRHRADPDRADGSGCRTRGCCGARRWPDSASRPSRSSSGSASSTPSPDARSPRASTGSSCGCPGHRPCSWRWPLRTPSPGSCSSGSWPADAPSTPRTPGHRPIRVPPPTLPVDPPLPRAGGRRSSKSRKPRDTRNLWAACSLLTSSARYDVVRMRTPGRCRTLPGLADAAGRGPAEQPEREAGLTWASRSRSKG